MIPPPKKFDVHLGLFADDTCICATYHKKIMFSESCNEISVLLRLGVNAGAKNSIKIRLRPPTFLIDLGPESESELLYEWWFTANQFDLAPSPL
jgi:hypothetical protein